MLANRVHLVERGAEVGGLDAEHGRQECRIAARRLELVEVGLEGGEKVAVGDHLVGEDVLF